MSHAPDAGRPGAGESATSPGWIAVCGVEATRRRSIVPVRASELRLIIVRDSEAIHAFERACPHEQADLAEGRCANGRLFCPRHDAWFRLADGQVSPGWSFRPLRRFPSRVEGLQVLVNIGTDRNSRSIAAGR